MNPFPDHGGTNALTTVFAWDLSAPAADPQFRSIAFNPNTFYVSANRIYLADSYRGWWTGRDRTGIVSFSADKELTPQARGELQGYTLNRYAFSEKDGVLRVTTETDDAHLYTLEEKDGGFEIMGDIGGIGATFEDVKAVRYVGDYAYIITFQVVDPLHIVDLRHPRAPVLRGELEIPGYNICIHGDDHLVVIGV